VAPGGDLGFDEGFETVADAAAAIRELVAAANVEMNRPVVEAGLSALEAGGDFVDGVIAHDELARRENRRFLRQKGGCASLGARSIGAPFERGTSGHVRAASCRQLINLSGFGST
jgi:hypothetical protein